ncbi:MAG: DNRLRE domain-containing protein [Methanobacteriota archaeon]|nr:MAG: DNRLRE domain-containing protein [Euryarchaeota archaeon]
MHPRGRHPHGIARSLLLALVALSLLPLPLVRVAADPTITNNPDGTSTAVWDFSTPAQYALTNAAISGGTASLASQTTWWNSTTAADFAGPDSEVNIDRATWPGDVTLAATSGTMTLLTLQPGATGEDTYLDRNNPGTNHGADTTILFDGRNPQDWPLLRFDLTTVPAGAVIDDAMLGMYESTGVGNPVTGSARQVTSQWSELQATWNDRLTGVPWGAAGGDYNAHAVDIVTLDNTAGWRSWNVTNLVDLWYRGRLPNDGLIVTAPNPGAISTKTFFSSDYNVDPTRRPKLDIRYRILGASGTYVSKVGGPGTAAFWQTISWNPSDRSLASDEFGGPGLDPKWAWTNPPGAYDVGTTTPGSLHVVSSTGVDFNGGVFSGNMLSNDIVGDFSATMKFDANPTVSGQKAGILVWVANRDWYSVIKTNAAGVVNWQVRATADALTTTRANVGSGNPIPAWVRIDRTGTTFTAYTSTDGTTWTLRDTYSPGFEYPLSVRLGVVVADGLSGTAHTVDVDYVRVTFGNDATVSVSTRTGDVTPVDGTWSGWSAAYPTPAGSAMAGSSRYVEYRLSLAVTYPDHAPDLGDANLSWFRYQSAGTVETNDLTPSDLSAWGTLSTVQALNGQSITYEYSLNSGGTWTSVAPPADLSGVSAGTGKIRFRASLSTSNTLVTPTMNEIRLTYTHVLDHFYVTAPAAAAAGAPFSVTVTAKDALNATITPWTGSVALAARLLDGVTPGGGALGTTSLIITSGGTATLATETYPKAETIRILASFGSASGLSVGTLVSPGPADHIVITPSDVTLLPFDTQDFSAQAFDVYDNPIPSVSFAWTVGGGVGTLNSSSGSSVRFTASPPPANGTLTASFGAASAVAQIHVVWGVPPWVTIASPAAGAHVTGIVPITYSNSSDAVSLEFDYNRGSGWTLIGTTGALSGTFLWDTTGLDFAGGSLRAIVTNNRTMTNTTVVSPIEVDNTAPTIAITSVTDDQAGSGTLTIAYATAADVVRVDFTYFDGTWKVIGSDVTIDGSYVWTPGVPINGVTLRAVAVDDVNLMGADQRQGVGRYVVGPGPPSIAAIPDLHVRVGSTYRLNLTFYVTDPDTPLAGLAISTSDAPNVTGNPGPYPSIDVLYASAGTYLVTLWVSDGTDTAWTIVRVIASAQSPPASVAAIPSVTFDEDTVALNALGAPATAFFSDLDGDPMTFTVLDATNVRSRVNGNDTVDLWAVANWHGSEMLRLRATDPSGGFAEAAFLVVVRSVNDPPTLAIPLPAVSFNEDTVGTNVFGGNATLHFVDVDGDALNLTVLGAVVLSSRVNPDGTIDLWAPANWSGSETLRLRATDPSGSWAEGSFAVTVRPVNDVPVVTGALNAVTFDEDTVALDVFGGPAAAHFMDRDGDPLTFTVVGAAQIQFRVNANLTVDLWGAPNWFGSATPSLRATDTNGTWADAPFAVVVRPVNDPPVLAPIPDLRVDEGAAYTLDLDPYISDIDTNLSSITVTTDSAYVSVNGHVLTIAYPANATEAVLTITISDGAATASGPLRVSFAPPWWRAPYVLAMPPVGILAVVAVFARRAMFRPTKAFLVDERNRMLREFTLDPSCEVTYEQAVQAGALDAVEKPVKVQKYHAQTVRGDALAVVLLAYGPVNAEQVEFARELLVNIQDKFEDAVKARLQEVQAAEADLEAPRRALANGEAALSARSKAFGDALDAALRAQAKVAAEVASIQARQADLQTREVGLRDAQGRLTLETQELTGRRTTVESREVNASEKEATLSDRARSLQMRESQVAPLEKELSERESSVAVRETQMQEQSETITAKALELSRSRRDLEEREAKLAREKDVLEKARTDLDPQVRAFEARVAAFEEESTRTRGDLETRAKTLTTEQTGLTTERETFEAMRAEKSLVLSRKEGELSEGEERLTERGSALETQSHDLAAREAALSAGLNGVAEREAALTRDTLALDAARASFEPERRAFEERVARFDEEARRRKTDLDAQAKSLGEDQLKLSADRQAFDGMRSERSQWISTKEIELEAREQSLQEKEKAVRAQAEENARHLADLAAREEALEIETDKAERARSDLVVRGQEQERLAKTLDAKGAELRDLEARKAEEFRTWEATMDSQQALLRQQREAHERDSTERNEQWAMRTLRVEQKEADLVERETKVRSDVEYVSRADEDVKRREVAVGAAQKSLAEATAKAEAAERSMNERTFDIDRRERLLREEAARITDDLARRGAAMRTSEAELQAKREQLERETATRQQQTEATEHELSDRTRSLEAKAKELSEWEIRATTIEGNLHEREERATREAQQNATGTRHLQARQLELDQVAQRIETDSNRIRAEGEAMRQSYAAREAELKSERERLERESNALQDRLGAKAQELASREKALAARETEGTQVHQQFQSERTAWTDTHRREMKQLEATQGAVAEQTQKAEKLLEEAQRRAYLASEAERTAKRQTDELVAQQAQLEARRSAAEQAERTAEAKIAQLSESARNLAAKENEITALTRDLKEREGRIGVIASDASRAAEDLKRERAALDQETSRLQKAVRDLEARNAELGARGSQVDAKAAELVQRERVLTTELQRAENLMEDLNAKETDLKSREKGLATGQSDLAKREVDLGRKDGELRKGMESLELMQKEMEGRLTQADRDQETATKAREDGLALKTAAERDRAQVDAMQQEVQKSTKFLQKKAVETLDREEKVRKRELASEEKDKALDARAEILDGKEKDLELDRREIETKVERLQTDIRRLREKLAEAEKSAGTSAEMEEWRKDLDARVKIVQKKAFDLLDREEKLRKREEEVRAMAEKLGVPL